MHATSRVRLVAQHLFGARADDAVQLLLLYGGGSEAERVHLAILKLSAGDLEALEREVDVARTDYRDVLVPAEYPRQHRLGWRKGPLSRIRAWLAEWRDTREYAAWLRQFPLSRPEE